MNTRSTSSSTPPRRPWARECPHRTVRVGWSGTACRATRWWYGWTRTGRAARAVAPRCAGPGRRTRSAMAERLIAIEGLDGAGKTTQVSLLAERLAPHEVVSFPRYDTFFGRQIRMLLDGVGGISAQTVDPRSMALWYALDRAQWARDRKAGSDGVVLLNRYALSNAVYQSARSESARDQRRLGAAPIG